MKRIGLDIDGVITADPARYVQLAATIFAHGGEVHVVMSRSEQAHKETIEELRGYGLRYTALHLIPPMSAAKQLCPHPGLSWYDQWLYGKVAYASEHRLTHFVDDDEKVNGLLRKYAPRILCPQPSGAEM